MTLYLKLMIGVFLCSHYVTHTYIPHEVCITQMSNDLYPITQPYHAEYIVVSPIHTLYYAEFGNPNGMPVLVVHGGPGAGCSATWSQFFDPSFYHVIMLDQRGAGKSIPEAEMSENTSEKLVADMELLRIKLGIEKWILFGGSWGSALSLLYAETYPERVHGMVLRGIFLACKNDYEHLLYGMKQYYPEEYDTLLQTIGASEGDDILTHLYELLMNPDPLVHMPAAHAFMRFDTICGTLLPSPELVTEQAADDHSSLCIARAFIYYAKHQFFLLENQLLDHVDVIRDIPTLLVHGRYDMICRIKIAYTLYQKLSHAALWIVPDAGHFSSECSITRNLCHAMDVMKGIQE